jgi:hypothetical protein
VSELRIAPGANASARSEGSDTQKLKKLGLGTGALKNLVAERDVEIEVRRRSRQKW